MKDKNYKPTEDLGRALITALQASVLPLRKKALHFLLLLAESKRVGPVRLFAWFESIVPVVRP